MVSEHPETDHASAPVADAAGVDAATGTHRPEAPRAPLTEAELLQFRCVRNAAYHEDWEYYYARVHRTLMFVVVFGGTLSIGASLAIYLSQGHDNIWPVAGTLAAVIAGLVDVVWNIDGLAREHGILRRRCYDLIARSQAGESPASLQAAFTRIVADEPPAMHAVNALAFNAAVDALGRPIDQKYVLRWWQIWLRHWLRFRPNEFRTIKDVSATAKTASRAA
jgi:hypothetical protein